MCTWFFFNKKSEIHTGKNIESSRNGAGQTGWLHLEECK